MTNDTLLESSYALLIKSKQSFSLQPEKLVFQEVCLRIQSVLGLKVGLWVFWKSHKISPIVIEL